MNPSTPPFPSIQLPQRATLVYARNVGKSLSLAKMLELMGNYPWPNPVWPIRMQPRQTGKSRTSMLLHWIDIYGERLRKMFRELPTRYSIEAFNARCPRMRFSTVDHMAHLNLIELPVPEQLKDVKPERKISLENPYGRGQTPYFVTAESTPLLPSDAEQPS